MRLLVPIVAFALGGSLSSAAAPGAANPSPPDRTEAETGLSTGVTPSTGHSHIDVDWLAVRGGGGNGGFYSLVSLVTLRWESFYWSIARGGVFGFGSGGEPLFSHVDPYFILLAGTAVGYPWQLGDSGMHELRIGLGVEIGRGESDWGDSSVVGEDSEDSDDDTAVLFYPIVVAPELYYVWHFERHVAFLLGIDCHYAPIERFRGKTHDELRARLPAFSAFVGAAF